MEPASQRPRAAANWRESATTVALVAASIWLGWQIIGVPLAERASPSVAVRIAPGSDRVLARAAEAELEADRADNARELARLSLAKTPLNVTALRVLGLAAAADGQRDDADALLTLAGNLSLRDGVTHAWLVEHRLRRGDYSSSFAHAETLVRRREELRPQVFRLFTEAASQDPRAMSALIARLDPNPAWRRAYLDSLLSTDQGQLLYSRLAVALQSRDHPLSTAELQSIYMRWFSSLRLPAIRALREELNRPDRTALVVNGEFNPVVDPLPFAWNIQQAPGVYAELVADDVREGERALRVEYDGDPFQPIIQQLLFLRPGRYELRQQSRTEFGGAGDRLGWEVVCLENGTRLVRTSGPRGQAWRTDSTSFAVPASGCEYQWLRLAPSASENTSPLAAWFDSVTVVRATS